MKIYSDEKPDKLATATRMLDWVVEKYGMTVTEPNGTIRPPTYDEAFWTLCKIIDEHPDNPKNMKD